MTKVADQLPQDKLADFSSRYATAYMWMLKARLVEDKMASLYRGGKIVGGVYVGKGQEALSASLGMALREGDIFAPLIRDQAGRLAFGEPLKDCIQTYLGSRLGPMRGRDGNVHRGRPREGIYPMISHLGAMISVVSGSLMARKMAHRTGSVGATCIGDGATSTGAFHEALNQAAIEKLPLVVVVANNQFAYSTPISRQFACRSLVDRAVGYGIEGVEVDGVSLESCLQKVGASVDRARQGAGPQLIIANLLRLSGHGEHDDASYVSEELRQSKLGRDCLVLAHQELIRKGWKTEEELEALWTDLAREIEQAVAEVQKEPAPDPFEEEWRALSTEHLTEGGQ